MHSRAETNFPFLVGRGERRAGAMQSRLHGSSTEERTGTGHHHGSEHDRMGCNWWRIFVVDLAKKRDSRSPATAHLVLHTVRASERASERCERKKGTRAEHTNKPRIHHRSSLSLSSSPSIHSNHIMPVSATNWADEVDGEDQPQTFTDANGITTTIEYRTNDDGKKVKVPKPASGSASRSCHTHHILAFPFLLRLPLLASPCPISFHSLVLSHSTRANGSHDHISRPFTSCLSRSLFSLPIRL